jgi:predicted nucleic acid-binding protein
VTFVLDASIAACWCFHDEHDPRADAAWELLLHERARVPIQWWFEIRNVVLQGERRGRITEQYTADFLQRLERFAIDSADLPDQAATLVLARRHHLTFYDAAYLELAKRENIALATLDRNLATAALAEAVQLVASP